MALVSDAGTPGHLRSRASVSCAMRARKAWPSFPCPGRARPWPPCPSPGCPPTASCSSASSPRGRHARRQALEELAGQRETLVLYEAPTRVVAALADMVEVWGDRDAFLCREATKVHEEYVRGSLAALRERLAAAARR